MNLEDVLLLGTRAAQPAATTVAEGKLYSITDEDNLVEQSRGGAWVTYAGVGAGGGSGAMPPIFFKPTDNEPPTTAFATLDTRNVHPVLDFDATTDEEAVFTAFLPAAYAGGGLTVETFWSTVATSGNFVVDAAIERNALASLDIDTDSFAAVQSATVTANGTVGFIVKGTITFTSGAQMDSLVAGEMFRLKIRRDANNAADTMTGDAQLLLVVIKET